ncbi:hypothetical protein P170DRAFT_131201 [Aspergillus steynii IBT 23096]|uniref:Uncharacterized protein n=1 Tax=Aspergillus steynii IBT 23096 TaxID=1392250 RepID=A0A2I2GKS6_9EURO|nr:uncharacterized protein P170DRAFT_131201 [Aspergillus steynii IBT 23096]PLB53493.1 hypothetical protein P170DRAFT_131201 [Aspergillus steynii IBT 23096]
MPLNILDLPSELLDRIVGLVLTHRDSPPSTSDRLHTFGDRILVLRPLPTGRNDYDKSYGYGNVKYYANQEPLYHNWTSASASLLLVNRQLAEVTRWRLGQLSKSSHYALDVMLVNEMELWPTWTFLTPPCEQVDTLTATFRITGTSPTLDGRKFRFTSGQDEPPRIIWCFFHLLETFVECGPLAEHRQSEPQAESRDRFTIKNLTLDFKTPTGLMAPSSLEYDNWLEGHGNKDPRTSYTWPYNTVETLMMRPEWLVSLISDYIGYSLDMNMFSHNFGKFLMEHVGNIRICLDGSLVKMHSVEHRIKEHYDRMIARYTKFPLKMACYRFHLMIEKRKKGGLSVTEQYRV